MRIQRTHSAAATASGAPVRRREATRTGFSVTEEPPAQTTQAAAALRTVSGIEALMALQGQAESETDGRRRRAITQGRAALDALDQLKLALLAGTLDASTLRRLQSAARDLKDSSGDARLDDLLGQIDLRLQVEIAKLTPTVVP
jgi:hypothetical protein